MPVELFRRAGLAALSLAALAALAPADDAPGSSAGKLKGKRVAILVTDGFEQSEMVRPRKALDAAGARTVLVSPKEGEVRSWSKDDWGEKFKVDLALEKARAADFDALLLPGGVISPDKLRLDERAVALVKEFFAEGKPVAAICHGPWLLVEAGVVKGRKLTSWPSLKTDVSNAGGTWTDSAVVVDRGLVTSRKPADIPAFNRRMIEEFAEGKRDPKK